MDAYVRKILLSLLFSLNIAIAAPPDACTSNDTFNIGTGIHDITGPAAESGMMGYGMVKQKTAGIYQRLWARAFVIESPCNQQRVVFVNADLGQLFQGIKQQVVKTLQKKYGDRYSDENVLLTATHTHSGPGAYSTYFFYNITTLGFDRWHFNTIIDGIVAAIEQADHAMIPGRIKIAEGELRGVGYNRSASSYLENPLEERNRYQDNIDTTMTLLRFESLDGKPIGLINWYPLHGTSFNNKNLLINGDNKGYAAYLFEKEMKGQQHTGFIAAFAQAHAGDVSPNKPGHAGGEGLEGIVAAEQAGKPQYELARKLFDSASELIKGEVDYRHQFVEMNKVAVDPIYTGGKLQYTCPAAIGVSMLAGTDEGEGFGYQGMTCDSIDKVLPHLACDMVTTVCQGAKPIAISTGKMQPWPWTPQILPLQLVKIGNFYIAAVPFELTTMAGRRVKETIMQALPAQESHLALSTLANAYAGYVTTHEEYQPQRYEAASTHFGPYTLNALQQIFAGLSKAMVSRQSVESGPLPPDLSGMHINLRPGVLYDSKPSNVEFGSVKEDVRANYQRGEVVKVVFWGAHPRNDFRIGDTFLAIERLEDGVWYAIRNDNDWDTEYHWERNGVANSLVTIVWRTSKDLAPGKYRIGHYGNWKSLWSRKITPYTGYSSTFSLE